MKIEQFVMAYGVEQDRVRAILPKGFTSLRPVLRINVEIRDDKIGYLEFNAPAEKDGKRGWINIDNWHNVDFDKCELQIGDSIDFDIRHKGERALAADSDSNEQAKIKTTFHLENLKIEFTRVGIQGGCPSEKDNQGCFFKKEDWEQGDDKTMQSEEWIFNPAEEITSNKEFCDCEFKWDFDGEGACGKSVGETIPAFLEDVKQTYPKGDFTVRNAAVIPCVNEKVLGAYVVEFER